MRLSSPSGVTLLSSQLSSACSITSAWRKRMQRSGSSPAAISVAAVSYVRSRSSAGSYGTVTACRSTMQ